MDAAKLLLKTEAKTKRCSDRDFLILEVRPSVKRYLYFSEAIVYIAGRNYTPISSSLWTEICVLFLVISVLK